MAEKQFVHNKDESPKMFENAFLDFFSRVHVAVVPLIFVPFIGYFIYLSLFQYHLSMGLFTGLFVLGVVLWTFFEYWFHRLFFHMEPKSDLGKRIHFMAHGVHHDYPNDSLRLVMPPAVSLMLALIIYWTIFLCVQDYGLTAGLFSGFVTGYLIYDLMHFATHYSNYKGKWFQRIKKNHMLHHYKHHDSGFGLSSIFWDRVFGTLHDLNSDTPKS